MTIFCSALGSPRQSPTSPSNVVVKIALISSHFAQNSTLFWVGGDWRGSYSFSNITGRGPNTAPNDNFLFGFGFISSSTNSPQQCCAKKKHSFPPILRKIQLCLGWEGTGGVASVSNITGKGPNTAPNDNFLFGFGFISSSPHSTPQQCCGLKLALISTHFAQNSTLFGVGGEGRGR